MVWEREVSITQIDPSKHVVKDTPAARFFRRRLRCDDIMTFYHRVTGQWILAYWLNRVKHKVDELDDLGHNFELIDQPFVEMIERCWGPVDFKRMKNRVKQREAIRQKAELEEALEAQDMWNWLRRRTKDKAVVPYMLDMGNISGGQTIGHNLR